MQMDIEPPVSEARSLATQTQGLSGNMNLLNLSRGSSRRDENHSLMRENFSLFLPGNERVPHI